MRSSWVDVAILVPFLAGVVESNLDLRCYQCETRDNSLCTDEFLLPCPDNQAYDSCMTRVFRTKSDGEWIKKTCALGPCTLRDPSQTTGLGLDHCDRSQNEYDCVSCCKESGCNTGGGALSTPAMELIVAMLFAAAPLLRRY